MKTDSLNEMVRHRHTGGPIPSSTKSIGGNTKQHFKNCHCAWKPGLDHAHARIRIPM